MDKHSNRRGYRRLRRSPTAVRRKVKIARLGGGSGRGAATKFINSLKKWWKKNIVPLKALAAFHEAYVAVMLKLEGKVEKEYRGGGKKVAGDSQTWKLPCGDRVDDRVVLQFYNRVLASREFVSLVRLG
ncbi:hypothetical protein LINPERHAP1_LOCUS20875 [Linum perenne]